MPNLLAVLFPLVLLTACADQPAPQPPPPTLVQVAQPAQRDTVIYGDFPGQVSAMNEVEVRSKVTGILLSQEFREGQLVEAHQVLYRLDADSLTTQVEKAKGQLRDAEAALGKAQADARRYQALVEKGSIARKDVDDALAQLERAKGGEASAKAELEQTELALKDAVIRSPYQGRIGRSAVNVGTLVTANQTVLATVSTTDTARFDFAISERDYLAYFRPVLEQRAPQERGRSVEVELFLADGSAYGIAGHTIFADRALSATTGTFAISAVFPNPKEVLRPGMYGRARIPLREVKEALLVPQRAVQEVLGKSFLSLVDGENRVERRPVTMGPRVGEEWVVESGLKPEERVIVDGHHKVRPGQIVQPERLRDAISSRDGISGDSAAPTNN
jgi:membrane fusion protein, multidrug efflux system